ncbi:HEAT repeat domain-containing protein [Streptomyces sp. Act143]|uniref:HEAT repeat domain-containing protein n=1 Tax=Streptomyces sp. Act143 TaxID=2200760 RepID=UPI0035C1FB85
MPVTIEQVLRALQPEEPDYEQARRLGSEALPHLYGIVAAGTSQLAPKATYLASLIAAEGSAAVVNRAAQSADPALRVAAAAAARNLPARDSNDILVGLVADEDMGVRKVAVTSAGSEASAELKEGVRQISQSDAAPRIRELAAEVLDRMGS